MYAEITIRFHYEIREGILFVTGAYDTKTGARIPIASDVLCMGFGNAIKNERKEVVELLDRKFSPVDATVSEASPIPHQARPKMIIFEV